jgi:hypothetical protein
MLCSRSARVVRTRRPSTSARPNVYSVCVNPVAWLAIALLALGGSGCGARSTRSSPDSGTSLRRDGPQVRKDGPVIRLDGPIRLDAPIRLDGPGPGLDVRPLPDWNMPRLDGPQVTDGPQPCSSKIGTACSSASSCCPGLACVTIYTGARVCAPSCTPDDPLTPLVNEDSCKFNYACADVAQGGGQYVCLLRCSPTLGKNVCESGIACDPQTNQMTFGLDKAFCASPACTKNADCPVRLSKSCQVGAGGGCSGLPPTAFCAPDVPGATFGPGHCALPGSCELKSGLCAPHGQGKPTATVGDPCKQDSDCGSAMVCLMEQTDATGRVVQRNGYCAVDGCAFASTLIQRACPSNATCNLLYPGGRCFRKCDHQIAKGCRGHGPDKLGDYECYGWNNLSVGGQAITTSSSCEPAIYTCDFFGGSGLDCSVLGLQNNPTKMRCRNPQTGATLPAGSAGGVCMDDTES